MKDSKQELETEIHCLEMATFYAKIFYCEIREHSSLTTTYCVTTTDYKKLQALWKYLQAVIMICSNGASQGLVYSC